MATNRLTDYQPTQTELLQDLGPKLGKAKGGDGDDLFFRSVQIVRRAITDKVLPHGALRVFCFLVEFSWLRSYGSERPYVIVISQIRIAREIGANHRYVLKWLRLLIQRGYIAREKLEFLYRKKGGRKGRAFKSRYTILLESEGKGTTAPGPEGTTAPGPEGTTAPAGRGTTAPILGGREGREGGKADGPPDDAAFFQKLKKLYPREIRDQIDELNKLRKEFEADPKHWVRELRKDAADFIVYAQEQIAKHPERRDHYEQKIRDLKADPDSWKKKSLTLHGAAVVANFTRKMKLARLALAGVSESDLEPPTTKGT